MEKFHKSKARNLSPEFIRDLDILDVVEAAAYTRLSPSTLAKLRCYGGGPRFIRQSARKILYRRSDLDVWLASHVRDNTLGLKKVLGEVR